MKQLLIALIVLTTIPANAKLCSHWGQPMELGELDLAVLPEASGLAITSQFPERLYHINDSGNQPTIFITDWKGSVEHTLPFINSATDMEDLSHGKCGDDRCLFAGDIGDNDAKRPFIEIFWFKEMGSFTGQMPHLNRLKLKYPDKSHNAEGFFVHPKSGDVYLFTKEDGKSKKVALPLNVYRIPAATIASGTGEFVLEVVGQIDVARLLPGTKKKAQVVTAASVAPDGESFLLLTYGAVIEIKWNFISPLLPTANWIEGSDYQVMSLALEGQEAIDYLPDSSGFIVTTEGRDSGVAPIVQVKCE